MKRNTPLIQSVVWWLVLMILWSCQPPAPVSPSSPVPQQAAFSAPALSPAELEQARKRLPSDASLHPIYNAQGRLVSYATVYNPPRPVQEQTFSLQYILGNEFFPPYPHAPSLCHVASFLQPPNISRAQFRAWYTYSGWSPLGHPDPWRSQKDCQPVYQLSVEGLRKGVSADIPEQRFAPSSAADAALPLSDPLSILPYRAAVQVMAPCPLFYPDGYRRLVYSKTEACDGSSPAFSGAITLPEGSSEAPERPQPTPDPNEVRYCRYNLQRDFLDPEEARLRATDARVTRLESELESGWVSDFSTQALQPGPRRAPAGLFPNTDAPFRIQQDPSDNPEPIDSQPPPRPNAITRVSEDAVLYQHGRLQQLLDDLSQRLDSLQQSYQGLEDPEQQARALQQLNALRKGLEPSQEVLTHLLEAVDLTCKPEDNIERPASLDLLFARFNPDFSITLYGRVNHSDPSFDPSEIRPYFQGDLELIDDLEPPAFSSYGFFTLHVPFDAYDYSDAYLARLGESAFEPVPQIYVALTDAGFSIQNCQPHCASEPTPGDLSYGPIRPVYDCEREAFFNCSDEFIPQQQWSIALDQLQDEIAFTGVALGWPGIALANTAIFGIDVLVPETALDLILEMIPTGIVVKNSKTVVVKGVTYVTIGLEKATDWLKVKGDWSKIKGALFRKKTDDVSFHQNKTLSIADNVTAHIGDLEIRAQDAGFRQRILGIPGDADDFFKGLDTHIQNAKGYVEQGDQAMLKRELSQIKAALNHGTIVTKLMDQGRIMRGFEQKMPFTTRLPEIVNSDNSAQTATEQIVDFIYQPSASSATRIMAEVKSGRQGVLTKPFNPGRKPYKQAVRYFELAAQKGYKAEYYVKEADQHFIDMLVAASEKVKELYPQARIFNPQEDLILFKDILPPGQFYQ